MQRSSGNQQSAESAGPDVDGLIASARSGREEAFGRLFEAFRRHLLLVANQELPPGLRGKLGASDLVQETAVDARRDFPAFRGSTPEECFVWLRTILRHNVVDAVRRFKLSQKRAAALEVSLATPRGRREGWLVEMRRGPPDGSAIRREDEAILADTLLRLSADHQAVLRLRYWEGLSFVEIGTRLDRSAEAARKLWFRAVERLQEELNAARARETTGGSSHDHLERVPK